LGRGNTLTKLSEPDQRDRKKGLKAGLGICFDLVAQRGDGYGRQRVPRGGNLPMKRLAKEAKSAYSRKRSWLALAALVGFTSCAYQDGHFIDTFPAALRDYLPKGCVQEGEVTVRDGDEVKVMYKTPYATPPDLAILEVKYAVSAEHGFNKTDFQLTQQEATFFKVRGNHPEQHCGSWAIIKWRAEGIRAEKPPPGAVPPKVPNTAQSANAPVRG
jgi:hypothetical protein